MTRSTRAATTLALAVLASAAGVRSAVAEGYRYHAPAGDWTVGGNWISHLGGTGVLPGVGDSVFIGSTDPFGSASTAAVDVTSSVAAANLQLSNGPGDSGTINLQPGGTLNVTNFFVGSESPGSVNRLGGVLSVLTVNVGGGSTLDVLGGDTLLADGVLIAQGTGSTVNFNNLSGTISLMSVYNGG